MKIYRVLSDKEFKYFCEHHSLRSRQESIHGRPERFLDLRRASDAHGKFFFFYLNDAIFFCNSFRGNGYNGRNNIIEIEIDEKEAFPFLACGNYVFYEDDNATEKTLHNFPELYLSSEFVDKKIRGGEFRIIDYRERKTINPFPLSDAAREPNYVVLSDAIENIAAKRERINMLQTILSNEKKLEKLDNTNSKKAYMMAKEDIKQIESDLEKITGSIIDDIESVKQIFHKFALEHEKYMKLVPIEIQENEAKNAE